MSIPPLFLMVESCFWVCSPHLTFVVSSNGPLLWLLQWTFSCTSLCEPTCLRDMFTLGNGVYLPWIWLSTTIIVVPGQPPAMSKVVYVRKLLPTLTFYFCKSHEYKVISYCLDLFFYLSQEVWASLYMQGHDVWVDTMYPVPSQECEWERRSKPCSACLGELEVSAERADFC